MEGITADIMADIITMTIIMTRATTRITTLITFSNDSRNAGQFRSSSKRLPLFHAQNAAGLTHRTCFSASSAECRWPETETALPAADAVHSLPRMQGSADSAGCRKLE